MLLLCSCFVLIGSFQIIAQVDASDTLLDHSSPLPSANTNKSTTVTPVSAAPQTSFPTTPSAKVTSQPSQQACHAKDLKLTYTPCDENGNRWRVQVPVKRNCQLKYPAEPKRGVKCSFACTPGTYLDISTQNCHKCAGGKYSVGDGKRISNWDAIPEGFVSQGFDTKYNANQNIPSSGASGDVCKDAKWIPRGHYLESNGSACRSLLKYSVNLVRDGNISFTVRAGDDSSFFHVWVENALSCALDEYGNTNEKVDRYFAVSYEWKTYLLPLKEGANIVYFVASYFANNYEKPEHGGGSFDSSSEKTVAIKEIVVRGFASAYSCDTCPAGTYSSPGLSSCISCPENTYSSGGAAMCIACGSEEYSAIRSGKCLQRKPCSEKDYYMIWEPCKNGKTRKNFRWKEPHTCSTAKPDSVKLPAAAVEKEIDCPSCNPGQYNNGSKCVYCPKDHYSNGNEACKLCAPRTTGAPGLFYKFWTRFPSRPMHLFCLAKPASGCRTEQGWQVHDSYIDSGSGHSDDAELLIVIKILEFTKEVSVFKMDFSIYCPSGKCRMRLQMMDVDHTIHVIRTYEGDTERTIMTHTRYSNSPTRYRLVFEKKYLAANQTYKYSDARMKIYSIEITNVKMGGTAKCEKCESNGKDCIKCPTGSYIHHGKCTECPKDTYLKDEDSVSGLKSCIPCPLGTVSHPGSTFCHSNCQITHSGNQKYDFSALSGLHIVDGQKRFTTKGYQYYHQFRINFCGEKFVESVCVNNATNKAGFAAKAAICRSTIIPDNNMVVSAQSISVGEVLNDVSIVSVQAKKSNSSSIKRSQSDRIVFKFHSNRVTEVCKDGTFGIIRLICRPHVGGRGKIELGDGNGCHSETCDGCNYTFTVKTKHACAKCVESDYEVIKTACVNGVKKTHYVWKQPHVCVDDHIKPIDAMSECTIFEKSILDFKVIILAFLLGGLLLAIIVLYLCYRNRTLTYNYHRLIDSSQVKEGEMPASEMCALEDGEEEEEVIIAKGKGGANIMDRLRGMRKKKKDFSEFETINLDSMQGYSDNDDDDEI